MLSRTLTQVLEGRQDLERIACTTVVAASASRGAGEGLFGGEAEDVEVGDDDRKEEDAEVLRQDALLQTLVHSLKVAKERGEQALCLAQCAVGGRL